MKTVPIGKSDFKKLIEEGNYYVDKTRLIEELLNNNAEVTLFPRPRRFGKSLMVSMLENFFDIDKKDENKHLFDGLYISKSEVYERNFGKYPVIMVNLKETKADTYEKFLNQLKIHIARLFEQKRYVLTMLSDAEKEIYFSITNRCANEDLISQSVKYLSDWLERYHKEKVVILFDEYDAPISEAYIKGFYDEVMSIIKPLFSSSLKDNTSLKMGVLTGILRVSRESLFSDFNNPDIYDIMTPGYNDYFGFTKEDTEELLKYYGLEYTEDVKEYYDGYNFNGTHIYNPWSVLNYSGKKLLKPYWSNTSSNLLIKKSLSNLNDNDKKQIDRIIQGESISFTYDERLTYKDFDNPNLGKVLNLLLISGYLTFDREEISDVTGNTITYFKVPNREVKQELVKTIQEISFGQILSDISYYEDFLRSLLSNQKEDVEKFLNQILIGTSSHDIGREYAYEMYMLGLFGGFMNKNFIVKGNRESGTGRSDILIEKVDRSVGVVIEIKIVKDSVEFERLASAGKLQMQTREYYRELELDKVKNIYEYVFVFHEKSVIVR